MFVSFFTLRKGAIINRITLNLIYNNVSFSYKNYQNHEVIKHFLDGNIKITFQPTILVD